VPRERANTAGLLHAVGHVWVLAKAASSPGVLQDPMHLENLINDWRIPAARRLLQTWGMDPEFVESVCDHESADEATGTVPALTDLMFVCQLFNAYKDSPRELTTRLASSPAAARLGLRGRERELVFSNSADEVRAVRSALCD
jgi:HD-like signal output (HDOD) protein